ncbi:MAG: HDOD domain-containing protein [Planctomycetota bacterium]|nr:HDOD domain-containing protein [Planctomycetota bacterium]
MSGLTFDKPLPPALARADALPSLPAVAVEVLRLTQDPDCSLDDLAAILSRDPALSAKILKLANSPVFGPGHEVSTLQRATMVLGMKTVKLMSLSFSLIASLPGDGVGAFDYRGFWRRSLVAGVAGRGLAKVLGDGCADEAFLCGLLSHLGQLVLARCMPEEYDHVLAESDGHWPSIETENRLLGFCHSDVSGTLLEQWGLPPMIAQSVAYMFRPRDLPEESVRDVRELVDRMALVALVVSTLCGQRSGEALQCLHDLAADRFDLNDEQVEEFLLGLGSAIIEMGRLLHLNVDLGERRSIEKILDDARRQIVELSLGTAIDLKSAELRLDQLETRNQELELQTHTDDLTGVLDREAFDKALEREIHARLDGSLPQALGLLRVEIDDFGSLSEVHGQPATDEILRTIGKVLGLSTRKIDLCARYRENEFALLLPRITPNRMETVAERLRCGIETVVASCGGRWLRVTVSIGGACLAKSRSKADAQTLLRTAGACLEEARTGGGNRCEIRSGVDLPRG